ncbi:CrcB family protein [Campylobacter sp. RM9344]|uniref:Fluoride-specific ion channel FluC n=1 Tax=Campylobacter californiensis TaxID=1032243 RepID=A0AAW3ZT37_9BACT|nr:MULTISPECIES: CrcB family protein [unclassified Campylobacter]MBE2984297.1 CrcB family protein [Campylobacter sp. RM6883]MBE2994836.1 CrcB family protein [Campylobacter sp. RM6913]MBE3029388.1 CrcB family protein [Campylobacter sp. RM9344]MBE3607967.1 CrcB family protein [Campylobacter sp. RM9337]QCD50770.1 putative fluoride ion transporter [Campylobacter sp. RM6914]
MLNLILVGFGGFFGAIFRYGLDILINKIFITSFPLSILFINSLGSFFIGVLFSLKFDPSLKFFLITGLLGGFTTFSTFSYQTVTLFSKDPILAFANIFLSVFMCITFCYLGVLVSKNFI